MIYFFFYVTLLFYCKSYITVIKAPPMYDSLRNIVMFVSFNGPNIIFDGAGLV